MTPEVAQQRAEFFGYIFRWEKSVRMWALYPKDMSREAEYFTRATLAQLTPERFIEIYLK